jgi:hypothetical protein
MACFKRTAHAHALQYGGLLQQILMCVFVRVGMLWYHWVDDNLVASAGLHAHIHMSVICNTKAPYRRALTCEAEHTAPPACAAAVGAAARRLLQVRRYWALAHGCTWLREWHAVWRACVVEH